MLAHASVPRELHAFALLCSSCWDDKDVIWRNFAELLADKNRWVETVSFWFTVWDSLVVGFNAALDIYCGFKGRRQLMYGQQSIRSQLYPALRWFKPWLVYGSEWIESIHWILLNFSLKTGWKCPWSSAIGLRLQQFSSFIFRMDLTFQCGFSLIQLQASSS